MILLVTKLEVEEVLLLSLVVGSFRTTYFLDIFFGQGEENRVTLFKARPVHEIKVKFCCS